MNSYQHQKSKADQREIEMETTHCIDYEVSGDLKRQDSDTW